MMVSQELIARRGLFNEPRNVAIFLNRKLRRDSLKEIGRQFQMEKYSSISSIIERMKKQMLTDSTLKRSVDRMVDRVSKGQEQTRTDLTRTTNYARGPRHRNYPRFVLLH